MDNDCPGEQVCENGACVAPESLPPPPAAAPPPAAVAAPPAGPTRASIAAEPPAEQEAPLQPTKPATKRHSTGMMAMGIVMTSIGPIPLLMSMAYSIGKSSCQSGGLFSEDRNAGVGCNRNDTAMYTTLLLGVGLLSAGIPMIVIGGKRGPIARASLTPWAAPQAGGLNLRLDL